MMDFSFEVSTRCLPSGEAVKGHGLIRADNRHKKVSGL
jgi:hypothetical protein